MSRLYTRDELCRMEGVLLRNDPVTVASLLRIRSPERRREDLNRLPLRLRSEVVTLLRQNGVATELSVWLTRLDVALGGDKRRQLEEQAAVLRGELMKVEYALLALAEGS